jgi:hypothetical protein
MACVRCHRARNDIGSYSQCGLPSSGVHATGYFRTNGPTRWFCTPLRPMHDKRRVARELPSNITLERTAGSHALAASAQRERCYDFQCQELAANFFRLA